MGKKMVALFISIIAVLSLFTTFTTVAHADWTSSFGGSVGTGGWGIAKSYLLFCCAGQGNRHSAE